MCSTRIHRTLCCNEKQLDGCLDLQPRHPSTHLPIHPRTYSSTHLLTHPRTHAPPPHPLVTRGTLLYSTFRVPFPPSPRMCRALLADFSPYGAVFKLSTKIGSVTAYTDPMTGDEVLHCFGFNGGRYFADLGVLAAVGGCGLALAFVFLKRSR